nr:hypothetical protein [Paenibacillus xylanexedens]
MIVSINKLPAYMSTYFQKHIDSTDVNVWWSNCRNEEGEDYCKLSVESVDGDTIYYYDETWGSINNIGEALEELG